MGYPTPIEWTDATWNPVGGCDIYTPGCTNCYAMRLAASPRLRGHPLYSGTTRMVKGNPVWNGILTVAADNHPVWGWPMGWRGAKEPKLGTGKPSMIFVGDMSDMFHRRRPIADIDRVMIAGLRSPHIVQLLTKRADVMVDYVKNFSHQRAVLNCAEGDGSMVPTILRDSYDSLERKFGLRDPWPGQPDCSAWPNPRLWLGFSAEDQRRMSERWSAVRPLAETGWQIFISVEPMLERIGLPHDVGRMPKKPWIICGGESGPDARPVHPDWVRRLRDDCAHYGLPFFFKQWGGWTEVDPSEPGAQLIGFDPDVAEHDCAFDQSRAAYMVRAGKKAAGRKLDGRTHDEFPEFGS